MIIYRILVFILVFIITSLIIKMRKNHGILFISDKNDTTENWNLEITIPIDDIYKLKQLKLKIKKEE